MPKITFAPWRNTSELRAVRDQFYSPSQSELDLRANACRTVEVWKLRGHLPHAVEATALLTDAILHDDASKNSVFSIRATYSVAFCRFVTGMVDSRLHGLKRTMFQRAMDLELPASFVELRHEATHRELPSLVVLRGATQRSLEWLWDYYWAHIDLSTVDGTADIDMQDSHVQLEAIRADIRQTLGEMSRKLVEEPARKKFKDYNTDSVAKNLTTICKLRSQGTQTLSKVLLEDMLVLSDRQLNAPMEPSFSRWDQLLQAISAKHTSFLNVLTEEMVNVLATGVDSDVKDNPFYEGIYWWLVHILSSKTWEEHRSVLSSTYLLAVCDEISNKWTKSLSDLLYNVRVSPRPSRPVDSSQDKSSAEQETAPLEHVSEELRLYGWEIPDRWASAPLGMVDV